MTKVCLTAERRRGEEMTTLKTMKHVLNEVDEYKKPVIRAVIKDIGIEAVEDVVNHGADSCFGNFCYYKDTCAFYQKHKIAIDRWIKEMAEELGERSSVDLIAGFNCLKDNATLEEIGKTLYGKADDSTIQVENALAWFALEETCRLFDK